MADGGNEILVGRGGNLVYWSKIVDAINAVCQLTIVREASETNKPRIAGSGSLATCVIKGKEETVILTNNHVVTNKDMAAKFTATFNFNGMEEPKAIYLCPDLFFKTGNKLDFDYTMVGVKPEDVDYLKTQLNIYPLALNPVDRDDLFKINIIHIAQHPGGKPKQLSMGRVYQFQGMFILYDADTDGGSSGSPVFFVQDGVCRVLALHKSGGVASSCKHLVNKGLFLNIILNHVNDGSIELLSDRRLKSSLALTPQEIGRIGRRIPDKWEAIAAATGCFEDYEIKVIKRDSSYADAADKASEILHRYKKKNKTRDILARALEEYGFVDLAEKLRNRYFQFNSS